MNIYEHCFLSATHFYIFIHLSACFVFLIVLKEGTVYSVMYFYWHIFAIFLNGKKHSTLDQSYFSLGERQTYIKEIMLFVKISIE